ncbi:MAG TPA: CHAP domain-containing protein [Marmoricola sp.]
MSRAVLAAILGLLATVLITVQAQQAHAAVIGDDYPASVAKKNVDPWRFYSGECTSFVAWRINHQLGVDFNDFWLVHWGNASNWKHAAQSSAVKATGVSVDHTPNVGAIAWWAAGSAGSSSGHVAWVAVVNDSSITIEEYNYLHHHKYDVRTIDRGDRRWPTGFIHFPGNVIVNRSVPKVIGTAQVGQTLQATTGLWTVSGKTFSYQWLAGGQPIAGATRNTFLVTPDYLGKTITVRVTASKKGYPSAQATSDQTAAVAVGSFTNSTPPTIVGMPRVGASIGVQPGSWSPAASYSYQWFVNHKRVDGATTTSFAPDASKLGAEINVRVIATATGYHKKKAWATPVTIARGQMRMVSRPVVTGAVRLGQTLSAQPPRFNISPTRIRYQWYAEGVPVTRATGRSIVLKQAQIGKKITVLATAAAPGYRNAPARSVPTAAVTRGTVTFAQKVRVSGMRKVGKVLTAHVPSTSPSWARLHYQWLRNGKAIADATGRTYRTVDADIAHHISVRVTATATSWLPGHTAVARTGVIRSKPVVTATAVVSGTKHRYVTVKLLVDAPHVRYEHGAATVSEGSHEWGPGDVFHSRGTVVVGTLAPGRHHLVIQFTGAGATLYGRTELDVTTR